MEAINKNEERKKKNIRAINGLRVGPTSPLIHKVRSHKIKSRKIKLGLQVGCKIKMKQNKGRKQILLQNMKVAKVHNPENRSQEKDIKIEDQSHVEVLDTEVMVVMENAELRESELESKKNSDPTTKKIEIATRERQRK